MFVRSLVGVFALVVAFGPLIAGSRSLRRKLLPVWTGPPGWLAQFVAILTACLVTIHALGVIHLFSLVPTTLVLAGTGLGMYAVGSRLSAREMAPLEREPERLGRAGQVVAIIAMSFFAATWGARVYVALSHGMVSIDSLWYHLPQAARLANEHSITGIHHDVMEISGFYPINAELAHSLGMVLLGNDLLSMVLTTIWGIVALLAAWCIGRPHGMAAACVTGVAVLLCAPAFVGTQPGAAHNDIVGITLLLTSAALLVTANPTRLTGNPVVIALAAVPIGFAVGAKWTLVPVSIAMTIGVLVLFPRARRIRLSAIWLAIVGALGSFSYVRNLIKAGSPLPNIDLRIGSIGWARAAPEIGGTGSVSQFLFDGAAWRQWFLPGLSQFFGIAWWAVLAALLLGLLLAIVLGPGSLTRMLGCVGLVALIGYLVQPQVLIIYEQPTLFYTNVRYGSVAMAFGLVLLPVSPLFRRRGVAWIPSVAFITIIAVMQLDPTLWPTELRDLRWENPVTDADAVAGAVIGAVVLAAGLGCVFLGTRVRSQPFARRMAGVAGAFVVLLVGGLAVNQWYLGQRYTRPDSPTPFLAQHFRSWEWARDIHDARIGFNSPALSYPLFGNQLTNVVEALPEPEPHAGGTLPKDARTRCIDFRRAVNQQRFDYIVLYDSLAPVANLPAGTPLNAAATAERGWLDSDPAATRVFEAPQEVVFQIAGPLDPEMCPAVSP